MVVYGTMANPNLAGDPNPEPFVPEFIPRTTPHAKRLAHHVVEPIAPKLRAVPAPATANRSAAAARMAAKNPQQESDPNSPSNADIMGALRALGPALDNIQRRLEHVERSTGAFEPPPSVAPPSPAPSTPARDTEVTGGR